MAHYSRHDVRRGLSALRWPLRLTRAGMFAENLWQATWPLVTVCLGGFGGADAGPAGQCFGRSGLGCSCGRGFWPCIAALIYAFARFRIPTTRCRPGAAG